MSEKGSKQQLMEEILPSDTTMASSKASGVPPVAQKKSSFIEDTIPLPDPDTTDLPATIEEATEIAVSAAAAAVSKAASAAAAAVSKTAALTGSQPAVIAAASKAAEAVSKAASQAAAEVSKAASQAQAAAVSKAASQAKALSAFPSVSFDVASNLYEKDGQWKLEKMPREFRQTGKKVRTAAPSKTAVQSKSKPPVSEDPDEADYIEIVTSSIVNNNNLNGSKSNSGLPARKKCCLDKGGQPLTFVQNVKAIYDTLSGKESYPCNECDRPICQESMWHWFSSIVSDMVDSAKEFTTKPMSSSTGCGSMDADTLRDNTKGTYAAFDDISKEIPKESSEGGNSLYEKDGQWELEKNPADLLQKGNKGGPSKSASYAAKKTPASKTTMKDPEKSEGDDSSASAEKSTAAATGSKSGKGSGIAITKSNNPEGSGTGIAKSETAKGSATGTTPENADGSAAGATKSNNPPAAWDEPAKADEEPAKILSKDMDIKIELQEESPAVAEPLSSSATEEPTTSEVTADKSHVQSMVKLYESKAEEAKSKTEIVASVLEEPEREPGPPGPRDSKRAFLLKNGEDPSNTSIGKK